MDDDLRRPVADAGSDGSAPPDRPSGTTPVTWFDGHIGAETLSAWISDPEDFVIQDRQAIEEHLTVCERCQTTLAELRDMVAALRSLPVIDPPRSFHLTPAVAARRKPTQEQPREPEPVRGPNPWYERPMHALRWATAVAAVLFVFVITADVLTTAVGGEVDDEEAASVAIQEAAEAPQAGGAEAEMADEPAGIMETAGTPEISAASEALTEDQVTTPVAEADVAEAPTVEPVPEMEMEADQARVAQEQRAEAVDEDDSPGIDRWLRVIEIGLAVVIVLLIAAMIALPRLGPSRR